MGHAKEQKTNEGCSEGRRGYPCGRPGYLGERGYLVLGKRVHRAAQTGGTEMGF
jgi:hypothetical protein